MTERECSHDTQDETLDKVDSIEAALLGLTEAVVENARQIAELHNKVDAIMQHQKVPYKPPMGFMKDDNSSNKTPQLVNPYIQTIMIMVIGNIKEHSDDHAIRERVRALPQNP